MKRTLSMTLAAMLVLSTMGMLLVHGPVTMNARAAELTVGTGGDHATIQEALDLANPGDTVRVFAGEYLGQIYVNKTLTIIGNGTGNTTINAQELGHTVLVSANWVNITGLNITGAKPDTSSGVYINNVHNCSIYRNDFYAGQYAVQIVSAGANDNVIANNTAKTSGALIRVANGRRTVVHNNTMSSTAIGNIGIFFSSGANNPVITSNTVSMGGGISGDASVLFLWSISGATVIGNSFSNSFSSVLIRGTTSGNNNLIRNNILTGSAYGVQFAQGVHHNTVQNNTITACSQNGVYILSGSNNNLVQENKINGGQRGIEISSSYENQILSNKVTNTTNHGLMLSNAECVGNNIVGNTFAHSAGHGIFSTSGANNNIFNQNNASYNTWSGMRIDNSHHNQVTSNAAESNGDHGLFLSDSHNDTVMSNHLHYNGDCGIRMEGSDDANIQNNNVFENWAGISIYLSNSNEIHENDLQANGDSFGGGDILLEDCDYNKIHNNTAMTIQRVGISISGASDENEVTGNELQGGQLGLYVYQSSGNTIITNEVNNSGVGIAAENSNYLAIYDNLVQNSSLYGISVSSSIYCWLYFNRVFNSSQNGIYFQSTTDSQIYQNNVSDTHSGRAVGLQNSHYNYVWQNSLTLSDDEAVLLSGSNANVIDGNFIFNNWRGVGINGTSDNNRVSGNVFVNQTDVHGFNQGSNNAWDNGYPMGGNYWDDHTGPDAYRGVNQDQTGADGFVDSPRAIPGGTLAQDTYPWANLNLTYVYKITDILMYPSVDMRVQANETVLVQAVLWDGDLGLPVPQSGVELEFDYYGFPPNGAASFTGPTTLLTDAAGYVEIEFNPGNAVGDHWKVTARNDTLGIPSNETQWIQVVEYRGELAIFDENQMNWSVLGEYEDTPVKQIVEKGVPVGETARFLVLVANTGSVNDTIRLSWDNSSFPAGWELAITEIEDVNVDPENWVETNISAAAINIDLFLEPGEARFFLFYVTSSASAAYGDEAFVQLEVQDYGYNYDRGTLRTYIPTPDAMYMVIGDTEAEVLGGETHPVPISDFLVDFMLPVNTELPPFWGVLYNETTGLPMEIAGVRWDITNMSGASAFMNITSGDTANTMTLNSGPTPGQVSIKASYLDPISGAWWNDTWNFNVTSGWDSVNITYTPGGIEVPDRMVTVGDEFDLWASVYNGTTGYITTTIMADWDGTGPVEQADWYQEGGIKVRFTGVGHAWVNVTIDMEGHTLTDSVYFHVVDVLHHVQIELANGSAPAGTYNADDSTTLYLRGYDQYGTLLGDYAGAWSLDGDNATLSAANGTSTIVDWNKVGIVNLTAQFGGMTDTIMVTVTNGAVATITVTPSGDTMMADETKQFTAVGHDADGNLVPGLTFVWSATNGNITGGLFTPWSAINVTVTATVGSVSGNATVTVTPGAAQSIIITPSAAGLVVGQSVNFTAEARDAKNNLVTTSFLWETENGTITADGVYTATHAGTWNVTASAGNATGTATVTVSEAPVPNQPPVANAGPDQTVEIGDLVRFNASASTDDNGIVNYTWTFTYNGTAVTLYGMQPTFTFWVTGNFTATCTVRDADGDTDSDDVKITVNATSDPDDDEDDDEEPVTAPIVIGPVVDQNGTPISGAAVIVTFNGTTYTGVTNATGYVVVNLPEDALGESVEVNISKDGYDPISYTADLGQDGIPTVQPEAMDEAEPDDDDDEEEEDDEGGLGDFTWIILIIVIVAVIGLVAFMMMGKGKAPAGAPEEPVPEEPISEDAEAMPGEAEPVAEEVVDGPAGEEIPPEE